MGRGRRLGLLKNANSLFASQILLIDLFEGPGCVLRLFQITQNKSRDLCGFVNTKSDVYVSVGTVVYKEKDN